MKTSFSKMLVVLASAGVLALLPACGGGGGSSGTSTSTLTDNAGGGDAGGSTSALKVAEKVSVVDAQSTSAKPSAAKPLKVNIPTLRAVSDLPAGSAYNTDETFVFVEERSAEAFNRINEILCSIAQTKYDQMIGEGNYKAQIDVDQCAQTSDSTSQQNSGSTQNQSSGSNQPNYEYWVVNSYRADNSSPHIVKAWIEQETDAESFEPAMDIHAKMEVTTSATDAPPYGIFTMNFVSYVSGTSTEMMHGNMRSYYDTDGTTILVDFVMEGGMDFNGDGSNDISMTEAVTLNKSAAGTGQGKTKAVEQILDPSAFGNFKAANPNADVRHQPSGKDRTYAIAFNTGNFLRDDGTTQVCTSRSSYDITTWRYGLYNSTTGARINISSGFPIRYTDSSGVHQNGWVGYYGIWAPGDSLTNGTTVYKQTFGPDKSTAEESYTVFIAGGKLKKHVKKTVTLGDIAGVALSWFDPASQTEYRVKWNKTSQQFIKSAQMNRSTWTWQNITESAVTFSQTDWSFDFYSEALGGSGRVNLWGADGQITPANTSSVIFHTEDVVYPNDSTVPSTLACFENCPSPSLINTSSPNFADTSWEGGGDTISHQEVAPSSATYYSYSFNPSSMNLTYGGTAVVQTAATSFGAWSGPLFEPTAANLASLACDWDQTGSSTCAWQAWDKLDAYYTWETGANNWNKFSGLQNSSGAFLTFDPPIMAEYTHTSGTKYYVEYSGYGDLHGIPGICIDEDTGTETDCFDSTGEKFLRWVPEFSIASGSAVTDVTSGATYYVKALESEERMAVVSSSSCSGLTSALATANAYTLPSINDYYQAPAIGAKPEMEGAPAVIAGVVQ